MGYNLAKRTMKKLAIVLIAMLGFCFAANAQQDKASVPGDYGNTVLVSVSDDSHTSSTLTFYNNSTKSIKVCVSVYNERGIKVGSDCYSVYGAAEHGYHSESTATLYKNSPSGTTSGCETKRIKIDSVTVQN